MHVSLRVPVKMLSFRAFICVLGAVAGIAAHRPAKATEFCVGTVAELDTALIAASVPVGPSVVIKVKQGQYLLGQSFLISNFSANYRNLELLGGYTSNCTQRVLNAENTVFDGENLNASLGMTGNLLIEGVRFEDFAPHNENAFGSLTISPSNPNLTLRLRSNVFVRTNVAMLNLDEEDITMIFESNLVTGAGLPPQTGGAALPQAVRIDVDRVDTRVRVNNTTIAGNLQKGLLVCSDGSISLGNNIIYGNVSTDVTLRTSDCIQPTSGTFLFNLYGSLVGSEAPGVSQGTSNANPLFVSNINFHLQNSSPAVNSGTLAVAGGIGQWDVEGRPRVVGTLPDRGAYESNVNNSSPGTLIVTNTNDAGVGSLRQAIQDANNTSGFNLIDFNISGPCPARITLQSELPHITDGVRINGFSQPGSRPNTVTDNDDAIRCVIVNGNAQANNGFYFEGSSTADFWLQGMAIEGFNVYGVRVESGDSAQIWGNQFGSGVGSVALAPNFINIRIGGSADGALIGGDSPAQINLIGGAIGYGVMLVNSSGNNTVLGNVFGILGIGADGNGSDNIYVTSPGNVIGGNVLVNSAASGVRLSGAGATGNLLYHNWIGIACPAAFGCGMSAPNAGHGVRIDGGASDNDFRYNNINNNLQAGIFVQGASLANEFRGNDTFLNGGAGIDLDGVTANDNDSAPGSANLPNRGLNHPVLTSASGTQNSSNVTGSLSSTNGQYFIYIFSSSQCDSGGRGEGEIYHGARAAVINNATSSADGTVSLQMGVEVPFGVDMSGRFITALAVDTAGNTSEFSNCVAYQLQAEDTVFANSFEAAN